MQIKKNNNTQQICPLVDRECLKEKCKIYHENFERCTIDLLAHNLYTLTTVLKNLPKKHE